MDDPPFPLTTIICENCLHKQVYNCFLRLTLLVIAVYVEQQYTIFCPVLLYHIVAVSLPPLPPCPRASSL